MQSVDTLLELALIDTFESTLFFTFYVATFQQH